MTQLQLRGVQMNGILDPLINYIQGKAKAGAEQAIPDIQQQVQQTVQPYIVASLGLGLFGFLFGLSAFIGMKHMRRNMRQA